MIYDNSKVRRQDRLLSEQRAKEIIETMEYGFLAMIDKEGLPYCIPLNYAYDGKNSFYVHCAKEGRKIDALKTNPLCTFTIVGNTKPLPDKFTTEYESVILQCNANINLSDEEKYLGHDVFIQKYCPNFLEQGRVYAQKSFHRMEIIRFDILQISGKAKKVIPLNP
ncbi:MAG: pyridoxamine 5'-phosphate oxidase family protein [Bacteroidales bacterium]|nr:pyridoxamine 5'-phosphate oxidase family protein [Bacteroidales bacterium]